MLRSVKQQTWSFHAELYNLILETHLLVSIQKHVDFTFIHESVRSFLLQILREARKWTRALVPFAVLQMLYSLLDERVVQEALVNLAYPWFVGWNPEDSLRDSFALPRFRNRRLGARTVDQVPLVIVGPCIQKGQIQSRTMVVGVTHTDRCNS